MDLTFKPFVALATYWRANVFNRARLKLTALYLVVMCLVTATFSVALYFSVTNNFRSSVRNSLRSEVDQKRFFEDRDSDIFGELILIDVFILLFSTAASYIFAGYTLKPIQRSLKAQEQFAADAAHELRTPLAVIRTQIEVLLRRPEALSEKVQTTLSSVLEETKGLTMITTDLLTLAREDAHQASSSNKQTALVEVIRESIRYIQRTADKKNITLLFKATESVLIQGNKPALKRIFLNVLDNATKYTARGGTILIQIDNNDPDNVLIKIQDTGTGIAKSDLPFIFDRFYKADTARRTKGAGLGLFIVKQLVAANKGKILFESEVSKGTTVTLQFKKI